MNKAYPKEFKFEIIPFSVYDKAKHADNIEVDIDENLEWRVRADGKTVTGAFKTTVRTMRGLTEAVVDRSVGAEHLPLLVAVRHPVYGIWLRGFFHEVPGQTVQDKAAALCWAAGWWLDPLNPKTGHASLIDIEDYLDL